MQRLPSLSTRIVLVVFALGVGSRLALAQGPRQKESGATAKENKTAHHEPAQSSAAPNVADGQPTDAAAPKGGTISDPADLEAFFDGALAIQMDGKHIAGAVVAVVVGDKLVFSKGYGYADIDARRKVDPEKTLFRIASITKLFTWTAVMQQVEAGKLDINTDINNYCKDVQVPATFQQPITLKDLLTHTPGFDDVVIGLFAHKVEAVRPLPQVLRAQMPARVRPPGVIASYSNQGTALAGAAVACVAGMAWEDYVEQRILQPLGMHHTLVLQPPAEKLPAELSKGYKWEAGKFEAQGFEYGPLAPAGSISTTAADAARFMLAHLHDGQLGAERILQPETARRMRGPLFRHDPKTSAMCYGFWEQDWNGLRIVGHGGDTNVFHSLMQLIPEHGVGFFVSYNTDTAGGERELLFNAFLRRYFPAPDPPRLSAATGFAARARALAGEYGNTRYSHTTPAKLAALYSVFKVGVNDDETITVTQGDKSRRFLEVEPLVFREIDGTEKIVFQQDKNGNATYLFPANLAAVSAARRQWYEWTWVQWGLLYGCVGILATAFLFWPAIAFSVRGGYCPAVKRDWRSGMLTCVAWLLAVVSVGFTAGLAYVLSDPDEIVFGLPLALKALLAIPQVCCVLAALTVVGCILAWRNRYWRLTGRLHYSLVALAGVGFVSFLYYWKLLNFGLNGIL
jgi:CubicO group peptidase (beta-lactamase class C family)